MQSSLSQTELEQTVYKYESFINDVLREDLRNLEQRIQKVNYEISDLTQQKHTLRVLNDKKIHPDGFKSQVNLGCNFFMEAKVTDTRKMLFDIGKQCYLEFTMEEANKFIDVRLEAYEKYTEQLREKVAMTKAHIKLMLINIHDLQNADKKVEEMSTSSARDR